MFIVFAAVVAMSNAPWFGLTVAASRPHCVEVDLVQPGSPAATGGIANRDCVAAVNGEAVRSRDMLARALRETVVGSEVVIQLASGRLLRLRPIERRADVERKYCEYVRSVRVHIKVFVAGTNSPVTMKELDLSRPISLGVLRAQSDAPASARIVQHDSCVSNPSVITDDPGDSYVVEDGAVVYFGYENVRLFKFPVDPPVDSVRQIGQKHD